MSAIPGGYILLARKMVDADSSWLMDKPPLWMKLWVWMLGKAFFRDGELLKRGQFHTSIKEMQEAMSYHVGFRKVTPTRDEIRSAYEYFAGRHEDPHEAPTKPPAITLTKATRGMVVTIQNYEKYQNQKSYEHHSEPHNENTVKPHCAPQDRLRKEKKENEPMRNFSTFWHEYPKKRDKQKAERAWQKLKPDESLLAEILKALEEQKASADWKQDGGKYIPLPSTWLNGRRWEDVLDTEHNQDAAGLQLVGGRRII